MADLNKEDILSEVRDKVTVQSYTKEEPIEGVKVLPVRDFVEEDGNFCEILRIDGSGNVEGLENFKIAQINKTMAFTNKIKAWHLHYSQDEAWYCMPSSQITVGLWDLREDSPTKGKKMKIVLGGGVSKILYIPRGVAHGYMNFSGKKAELIYFMSNKFNMEDPDERRLTWDAAGEDFWTFKKD